MRHLNLRGYRDPYCVSRGGNKFKKRIDSEGNLHELVERTLFITDELIISTLLDYDSSTQIHDLVDLLDEGNTVGD